MSEDTSLDSVEDEENEDLEEEGFNEAELEDRVVGRVAEMITSYVRKEIRDRFSEEIDRNKRNIRHLEDRMRMPVRVSPFTHKDRIMFVVALAVMAVAPWFLAPAVFHPGHSRPQVTVRPVINADEIVHQMSVNQIAIDQETGALFTLPPPADDASEFQATCRDVCRSQTNWSNRFPPLERRNGTRREPLEVQDRVLVNDPESQACTCLVRDQVIRFLGWRRVR